MLQRRLVVLLVFFLWVPQFAFGQQPSAQQPASALGPATQPPTAQAALAVPPKDANDPVERIKDEGLNRSQVMQTLNYLTNVIGPRLTGSPNMKRANIWTRDKMTEWGLKNAHLETWGPFGRGWSLQRFTIQVTEPQSFPLIAFPKAWSLGTNGVVTSDVVYVDATNEEELQRFKGRLRGAIVMVGQPRDIKARFEPLGTRLTERELQLLVNPPERAGRSGRYALLRAQARAAAALAARRLQFFIDEGVALVLDPSRGGDGGTLFVQSALVAQPVDTPYQQRVTPWSKNAPKNVPQVTVAVEHYNRIVRMLQQGEKVRMSVDLAVQFHDEDEMAYNTIAEIPGTDLKDEIVMLGAHMDSWHSGTGATDNAAGVGVVMEAVRILQALKLQPRRTIRVGLWSGEEQGLLGSHAYVAKHFGALGGNSTAALMAITMGVGPTLKVNPQSGYDKFSAYFNLDNGTGRIRGVYLQGNEAVRPIFEKWLAPFHELGAATLTSSNTGGTDHLSFDMVGLPGFQFIQDEIEYDTRTHHSNQDVYERLQADDLKQASVIMAAFVYNTAMLDEKLPRKPMLTR